MPRKKGSHNPERPSYRTASAEEYRAFYDRIEKSFSPEQMTPARLSEWLQSDSHPLIDQLALVKIINDQIRDSDNLQELNNLRNEISQLPLHRVSLTNRLNERINQVQVEIRESEITRTITLTQDFAKERGITLSDKTKGGVYQNWGRYHRPAVVIFRGGKILAWKYIK